MGLYGIILCHNNLVGDDCVVLCKWNVVRAPHLGWYWLMIMGHILPNNTPYIGDDHNQLWKHVETFFGIPVSLSVLILKKQLRLARCTLATGFWACGSRTNKARVGGRGDLIVAGCNGLVVRCGNGWNPVPKNRPMTGFICFFWYKCECCELKAGLIPILYNIVHIHKVRGVCVCVCIYIYIYTYIIIYIYTNAWYEQITYGYMDTQLYDVVCVCVCTWIMGVCANDYDRNLLKPAMEHGPPRWKFMNAKAVVTKDRRNHWLDMKNNRSREVQSEINGVDVLMKRC